MLTAIQHASIAAKVLTFSSPTMGAGSSAAAHTHAHGHGHGHPPNQLIRTTTAPNAAQSLAYEQLYPSTLLYLATLGGAGVCCLEDKVGNFVVGKEFDAIVVDLRTMNGNFAVWYNEGDNLETLVDRFLFGGDDRNIKEVYVCGRLIGGTSFKAGAETGSTHDSHAKARARL